MRPLEALSLLALAVLGAACSSRGLAPSGGGGAGGDSGRSGGDEASSASGSPSGGGAGSENGPTTSSTSGGAALTCQMVNGGIGCCDAGAVHFCSPSMILTDQHCAAGKVCGWSEPKGYYDCVSPPAGAEPNGVYPIACVGAGSTSSSTSGGSSSASTTASASTGGGATVTWTELYDTVFGPNGTSACSKNGGCHTVTKSVLSCGTTRASCYKGMVQSTLVTPGPDAPSSWLVSPTQSPLCGPLGGNMPQDGTCVTAAQLARIKTWLSEGAQDN